MTIYHVQHVTHVDENHRELSANSAAALMSFLASYSLLFWLYGPQTPP